MNTTLIGKFFSRYPVVGVGRISIPVQIQFCLDGSSDELHHLLSFTHLTIEGWDISDNNKE